MRKPNPFVGLVPLSRAATRALAKPEKTKRALHARGIEMQDSMPMARPSPMRTSLKGRMMTVAEIYNEFGKALCLSRTTIHQRIMSGRMGESILAVEAPRMGLFKPDGNAPRPTAGVKRARRIQTERETLYERLMQEQMGVEISTKGKS